MERWHRSITLSINAALDTRLDKPQPQKSELLLYMLALEIVAAQPVHFVELGNQSGTGKAEVREICRFGVCTLWGIHMTVG